jgi:ABC-type multidrug transport system fused ATPase/permease subunit
MERPRNIDFKYNLRVYWEISKRYKWLFLGVLLTVLIIEASRTVDKLLFKVIVDEGTKFAEKNILRSEYLNILLYVLVAFFVVMVIRALFKWLFLHGLNVLESKQIVDLKRKYFNHILSLSHSFHTTHRTGSMISRLIRGGGSMERMTDIVTFNVAPLIFQILLVSGSLFYFDRVSAIVLFITSVAFIGYSVMIQNLAKKANMEANDYEDYEKGHISDMFTNIDSIKYFGKESSIKKRYEDISEKTKEKQIANWHYHRWTDAGQSVILGIGLFFLIYFPLVRFLNGEITLGTIIFIYTIYGDVVSPLFGFVRGIREFYRTMADFESLFEYGKIENDIKDPENAQDITIRNGTVEFRNIDFYYGNRQIFQKFNLKIPKNRKIALVGHSGSGKSTLVKLLYRLYDVQKGQILIDGKDIRGYSQNSVRSEMSIVPQECILFDDTIYNNIAFSRPGATREQVLMAIRFAQLDIIISKFPKKEDTIVGERGVKLSGGEKQRVSIARAILADKKILVLDEATSSLDSQTEHEIQADLEKLMEGRTSIIIAHRLSTIMKADTIVVLKDGEILQMGTHKDLIRQKGEYRKLWNLQKGGYIK